MASAKIEIAQAMKQFGDDVLEASRRGIPLYDLEKARRAEQEAAEEH